jgi:hypothetical protein
MTFNYARIQEMPNMRKGNGDRQNRQSRAMFIRKQGDLLGHEIAPLYFLTVAMSNGELKVN